MNDKVEKSSSQENVLPVHSKAKISRLECRESRAGRAVQRRTGRVEGVPLVRSNCL
jgi:hypothetical protein